MSANTGKKYLSFVLIDGPDQFGNDGKVIHSISKEERLAGVKGEICGSWRHVGGGKTKTAARLTNRGRGPVLIERRGH